MNRKKQKILAVIAYLMLFIMILFAEYSLVDFEPPLSNDYCESLHYWIEIIDQNEEYFSYEETKSYLIGGHFPEQSVNRAFEFPESTTDVKLLEDWLIISNKPEENLDPMVEYYFDQDRKQLILKFTMPEFTVPSGERASLGFRAKIAYKTFDRGEYSREVGISFPNANEDNNGKLLSSSGFFQIILPPNYTFLDFIAESSSRDDKFILIPTNQSCARVFFVHFPKSNSDDSPGYSTVKIGTIFGENKGGVDSYPELDEISLWNDLHISQILNNQSRSLQIEMTVKASDGRPVTKVLSPLFYALERASIKRGTLSATVEGGAPLKIVTFEAKPHRLIEYLCTESGTPIAHAGESVQIYIEFQYSDEKTFESGNVYSTDPFGLLFLGSMDFVEYQLSIPENSGILGIYPFNGQTEKNKIMWKKSENDIDQILYFGASFVKYEKIPADAFLLGFPGFLGLILVYIAIFQIFLTLHEHRFEIILALISISFFICQQLHNELPIRNIHCLYTGSERALAFIGWWIPIATSLLCILIMLINYLERQNQGKIFSTFLSMNRI